MYRKPEPELLFSFTYRNFSELSPKTELNLWGHEPGLVVKRRYSTQPTSPLGPILLLPYPDGAGGPAFSFSERGKEKNLTA